MPGPRPILTAFNQLQQPAPTAKSVAHIPNQIIQEPIVVTIRESYEAHFQEAMENKPTADPSILKKLSLVEQNNQALILNKTGSKPI